MNFNFRLFLIIGFGIALFIILIWYLWAILIYKWNFDRLGGLILVRYSAINQDQLTDDTYYDYTNVQLSADKSYVTATIRLKNKISQVVLKSENVKYNIKTDESCTVIRFGCIEV